MELNVWNEKGDKRMKTSQNGIELIKRFEGCRLTAYRCAAGVPTIGYGHTAGVKMGQSITQKRAEAFLREDLEKYERNVQKYDDTYRWNQNEFDALVSFAYNVGSVNQLLAGGSRTKKTIAEKMLLYNKAAGRVLDELSKRRAAERDLFLKPVSEDVQAASVDAPHVQLNYRPGKDYTVCADGLRIRTKKASQSTLALPNGDIIGILDRGARIRNQATAQVGDAIWMYFGLDRKGREQWA